MLGTIDPVVAREGSATGLEAREWPRIAFVTPVLNNVRHIEATIRSVLAQDYRNLDYFVVDGGSTDGTVDVIREYEGQISGWISEPDNGMYEAINKGFARTSGEIMGWISGTDMLHPGGLRVVASVFRDLPEVEWINGRPSIFSEDGMTVSVYPVPRWSRYRFLAGANQCIQQEGTFWRRSLWDRAGGYVDASRRFMSDFELWVRFFRHARLYSVDALTGGYRTHGDALGRKHNDLCVRIQMEIIDAELDRTPEYKALHVLRTIGRAVRHIPKVRGFWQRVVKDNLIRAMYRLPGPDRPPVIEYNVIEEVKRLRVMQAVVCFG
jgi:glycosyltransferase involved in cell wall biosynthesis